MTVSHPLPDDLIELIADRFRALSEPTRIRLLDRLRESEATVLELTELIGTTQNVSKQLRILQRSGIVARRKQATSPTTGSSTRRLLALRGGLRQPPTAVRITPPARRRRERVMLGADRSSLVARTGGGGGRSD